MSTTVRTSTTTRLGTRLVALAGATASVAALGMATAAPASARATETSSSASASATTDCNRDLGEGTVNFNKRSWPLTGGLHMDTYEGTVDRSSGQVSATTHIYNSYWGMGYTGSTTVILRNSCGATIGVTQPAKWGVDAKTWFWSGNERYEHHSQSINSAITRRVASVQVVHNRVTGTAEYKARYNLIRDIACAAYTPACLLPRL